MSEGIQLSDELVADVFRTIASHDPAAEQDMMLGIQYLSAITGYLAAGFPGSDQECDEFLDQLAAFSKHVCDQQAESDKDKQASQPAAAEAAPGGRSVETSDPAMGIWTPE